MIGIWDMNELMVTKTISSNDFKVISISSSHDGQYLAGIFEDDINKKYQVEIHDVLNGGKRVFEK